MVCHRNTVYSKLLEGKTFAVREHRKKTYEKRLELYTVFVAVSKETARLTLWPLVIATAAVCTAVGHILNGHSVVGAVVHTEFCAVFSHWMTGSAVHSAVSPFH